MPLLGVVFDFDGVIADTEALHLRAYQNILADTPLSLLKAAYYERYLGYDDVGVFNAVAKDQGLTLDPAELTRLTVAKSRNFEALIDTDEMLFPESADCIRRLAGVTRLAVASGALRHEIERILTTTALREHFSVIVAAEDVDRPKPAPDSYLEAVSQLSRDFDVPLVGCYVAIEDSPWGLEAARSAGLKTIGITNSYPEARLTHADAVVDRLDIVDLSFLERLCQG